MWNTCMRTDGVVGITELAMVGFESQRHDISALLKQQRLGRLGAFKQRLGSFGWAMVLLLGVPLPLLVLACFILSR